MAKDDYYTMVYKFLRYLYECLKESTPTDPVKIATGSKMFPVDAEYRDYLLRNLAQEGYITGVKLLPIIGAEEPAVRVQNPKITPQGISYIQENSTMGKVEALLFKAGEIAGSIFLG